MEQQHRHHEVGQGCALCFLAPRQYSHGHLYLLCHPWGQEVLLGLGNLCHPGADKISTPNHPSFPPTAAVHQA